MLLAAFLILVFFFVKKRKNLIINFRQFLAIVLVAFFSMYFTNALEYYGLQHLSAAKTCFIYSLTPFFSAFFSYLHFHEKMNRVKWLGMFVGICGVAPVFFISTGPECVTDSFFKISYPEIAVIGATIFSVYGWILLRILVKDDKLSPVVANGWGMFMGGLFALAHSWFLDTWEPVPIIPGSYAPFFQGLIIITFISNIICYNIYGFLLKRFTATFMSFTGLFSPIFTSISEWLIFKTPPSPLIMISSLVTLLGLWIVYKEELKQGYILREQKL